MADDMSHMQIPLTIIVAATTKNGIGKNGGLPWPMIKKDMAYFARVTKRVPMLQDTGSIPSDTSKGKVLSQERRNLVIMGRKTWDSIPQRFRPLKDRTNVVISTKDRSDLQPIPSGVVLASDISTALESVEQLVQERRALPVGRAFVIGGASIYQAALQLPQTKHILMTRIKRDYDCDTFFPETLERHGEGHGEGHEPNVWTSAPHARVTEFIGEDVDEGPVREKIADDDDDDDDDEEELELEFQLFERH